MRSAVRHRHVEEEEESAFVSMTDMTVSFLFIVMVLLAFFASQINREDVVPQATYNLAVSERDAALASFEREQTAHQETRTRLADAQVEIAALEARIRELEALVADRDARILDLETEVADLDILLRQARLASEELRGQLTATRGELEAERAAHSDTRLELEAAKSRILSLAVQAADLDALLRHTLLNSEGLRWQLLARREELDAERAAHAETQRELEAAQARIRELEARLEELERPDPLEEYLSRPAVARLRLLQQLRDWLKLDFPDLQVVISAEGDALRFQGEGLFRPGSSTLRNEQQRIIEAIAQRLDDILPCYTLGIASVWEESCNPGLAVIEAVQIEGHTDADGSDLANLDLSTSRANATFAAMIGFMPGLVGHLNTRDQPVLSVAGYGEMRPVAPNDTPENKSTNRRIDLRIIMHTPASTEELDRIRGLLSAPLAREGE